MPQTNLVTVDDPIDLPFTDIEITQAINELPNQWGQLIAEGMFPFRPLTSQFFRLDLKSNVISALPVTHGGKATVARHGSRNMRILEVPSVDHEDTILAEDIRGWFAMSGNGTNLETFAALFNDRLATLQLKFDLTDEVMRTSALKGIVTDGAGDEVLNVFDVFDLEEKVVYFNFADANLNVRKVCELVHRLIVQDMSDEVMTIVEARVSSDFFEDLVSHPNVEKYWLQAEQAQALANLSRTKVGSYEPRRFLFGNILFIEVPAIVPMWNAGSEPLIANGEGHAYPAGTRDSHVTYIAPPPDIRLLDGSPASIKQRVHITTEPMKHGRGIELLGRMNIQPIWRRPKLLVHLFSGSGTSTEPTGS